MQHCKSCGRPIENLKKMIKNEIKYCSKKCRTEKFDTNDTELEKEITRFCLSSKEKNICPSKISQDVFKTSWKKEHHRVIKACRRLHLRGSLIITKDKKPIKSLNFKEPIRVKTI